MTRIKVSLQHVRAAIFDMDGTMVDNMDFHREAWQEFLRRHDIEMTDEEFREKLSGKNNERSLQIVFGRRLTPEELATYSEEKEAIYRELYGPHINEIDGLGSLISELHEREIKTAVATTAPAENREFVLEWIGLQHKFEVVVGDEHVEHSKPDPGIYLLAAERLGVEPGDCLAFEDSPSGVEAAKRAGITVIGVLSTHTEVELGRADYVINDFNDITFE